VSVETQSGLNWSEGVLIQKLAESGRPEADSAGI